ncbi:amidohydrolase family protein [Coprothermobacteraceae bacterium]|nr:amidohydrolase family protein [Coprothermobacteraceae bacterium]
MSNLVITNARVITPASVELEPISEKAILDQHGRAVVIKDGWIVDVVPASEAPVGDEWTVLDVEGALVTPAFVDPHTHSIFAGDRSSEFHARIQGQTYREQQQKGGINVTVEATRAVSDEQLLLSLKKWVRVFACQGTGTLEVKTGYGLSHHEELRLLQLIHGANTGIDLVPTYLGAHALPKDKGREQYLEEMVTKTIPALAETGLAEFVDVFVASVAFTPQEADVIFGRAALFGLKLKAHLWELEHDSSSFLLEKYHLTSIDHLEFATADDLQIAFKKGTVPTLLPLTAWHLGYSIKHTYQTIKELGGYFAVSTDFNPGTSFVPSPWQAINVGHIAFGIPVEELFLGYTAYAARAVAREDRGAVRPGYRADLMVLDVPDLSWLGYLQGVNPVRALIKNGRLIVDRRDMC